MAEGEDCDGAVTDGDEIEISGLWIICCCKSSVYWCFQCSIIGILNWFTGCR